MWQHGQSHQGVCGDAIATREGISRERPKGTFIGFGAVESDLQVLRSVWEDFRRLGMEPAVKVLSLQETSGDGIDPFLLSMESTRFLELTRLFAANHSPVSYDQAYFPLTEFEWLKKERLD